MINKIIDYKEPNLKTIIKRYDCYADKIIETSKKSLKIKNKTFHNYAINNEYKDIDIDIEIGNIFHLIGVNNNSEITKIVQEIQNIYFNKINKYMLETPELLENLIIIKEKEYEKLKKEEQQILNELILRLKLEGVGLNNKNKKRINKIDLKLSNYSTEYSENVINSMKNYKLIVTEKDMKGVLTTDKNRMLINKGKNKGKYKITLNINDYISYLYYGENRNIRKKLFKKYLKKATNNKKIVNEVLNLRLEKSKLLGFNNFAEYSLAKDKSALKTKEVSDMFKTFSKYTIKSAKKELKELKKEALKIDGIKKLQKWDIAFYTNKMEKKLFNIDKNKQMEYFEVENVLKGFFKFSEIYLNIYFKEIENTNTWNKDVRVFDLFDNNSKLLGRIYYDLFSRKNKSEGAWMDNKLSYHKDKEGNYNLPIVYVVTNYPKKDNNNKSFIEHNDVVTLFHEMGHAFHHLLSKIEYEELSGVNGVKWDVVEFPSQFLEYFSFEKDILKLFAKHYKTGEDFPEKEINKIIKAKNFRSASSTLRQTQLGILDFNLHLNYKNKKSIKKIYKDSINETSIKKINKKIKSIPILNTFTHIFSGGYAAGYYSYKWAEILSADAYIEFKNLKTKKEKIKKFKEIKEIIFETGGFENMIEKFEKFAKRKPKVESLLKIDEIISKKIRNMD